MAVATAPQQNKVERYRVIVGTHVDNNPNFDPVKLGITPDQVRLHPDRIKKYFANDVIESDRPLDRIFEGKFQKLSDLDQPKVVTEARRQAVAELIFGGQWEESDRHMLEGLSDDNFDRIVAHSSRRGPAHGPNPTAVQSPLGTEVTHTFTRAYDEGFKVFVNAQGKHQLTRGPNAKPLNKEPLDAKAVDKWVDQYLKDNK